MGDSRSAAFFGEAFRFLADTTHDSDAARAFARWLWKAADKFDFSLVEMDAEEAVAKLLPGHCVSCGREDGTHDEGAHE